LLLAGTGFYAWWTHARMADETEHRRQAEAALQDALTRTAALQQQVAQQQEALNAVRESVERRAGDVGDLQDTLIRREVELEQLQARVAQMEKESAGLRRALAQRDEMLTFLRSAHVRVISLAGLEAAKSAGAFLLYDQDSQKAFFYAFNMPPLPAGKTYQVWAIVEKPMSAGVFHPDEGQKGRLILKGLPALTDIRTFAVSVEPAGGSTQPRGQIYLAGRV
jgi:anti-sigma-K factor RskA